MGYASLECGKTEMRKCHEPSREIRGGKGMGHHLGASFTVGTIGA